MGVCGQRGIVRMFIPACKVSEGDPNPGKALEKWITCGLGPELRVAVMGTQAGSKWEIAKKGEKAVCSPS